MQPFVLLLSAGFKKAFLDWKPSARLLSAGHTGEELHSQPREEGLAERSLQQREVGGGADRQEDGAAGRRDLGRDPAGRAGPMSHGPLWVLHRAPRALICAGFFF